MTNHPLDSSAIDVRWLYTLETIYRVGSLSRAAEELNLSQPAVSHTLAKLRSMTGDPLFVRTAAGFTATPRAAQLAASARRIRGTVAAELDAAQEFDPSRVDRVFHLLMTDAGELVTLPPILQSVRKLAPRAHVRTVTLPPASMIEALNNGTADLAIGPFPELALSSLSRERLYQRGFLCLASADHPVVSQQGLTRDVFLELAHIVVESPGRSEEVFERYLAENGVSRQVICRVPYMISVPAIVARTDLIATVPHSVGMFFREYPGIEVHPVPFSHPAPPHTTVSQYWSSRFDRDTANAWLRTLVHDLLLEKDAASG